MFEIKKERSFSYQGKIQKFSVGSVISRQELVEKLNESNFLFYVKNGILEEIIETPQVETLQVETQPMEIIETLQVETQPEEIIETEYRFEKKRKPFKVGDTATESEIKDAGLDIETLLNEEAITWLK